MRAPVAGGKGGGTKAAGQALLPSFVTLIDKWHGFLIAIRHAPRLKFVLLESGPQNRGTRFPYPWPFPKLRDRMSELRTSLGAEAVDQQVDQAASLGFATGPRLDAPEEAENEQHVLGVDV